MLASVSISVLLPGCLAEGCPNEALPDRAPRLLVIIRSFGTNSSTDFFGYFGRPVCRASFTQLFSTGVVFPVCNIPTTNSGFLLDTTSAMPQNPPNFSKGLLSWRTSSEKFWRRLCNIFPAGPCNASMRNVWRAEHGCARIRCIRSYAQIVARRCIACRHPWVHGCDFVPARSVRIVRSGQGNKAGFQHETSTFRARSREFLPALGVKMAHGFRRGPLLRLGWSGGGAGVESTNKKSGQWRDRPLLRSY